ncbi:MAG: hypothetical protein U1F43_02155 [Myxococcota bacterium]
MKSVIRNVFVIAGAVVLPACAGAGSNGPGGTLQIATRPLTLPGIDQACFDVLVQNAAHETVWAMGDPETSWADGDDTTICSGQYGNGKGGDIAYVGTCDADGPNGTQMNTVTVWVDGLYDADGVDIADDGSSNWVNPCGTQGCTLEVACKENADASVVFDFTIMRDANQGFFDVAVNFEDIFCSAKFDCTDPDTDQPLQLLFQADGTRGDTVVAAFACTAGPGTETVLHIDGDIHVTCDSGTVDLDQSVGPGNAYTLATPDPDTSDAVWQYATYMGTEQLDCDGQTCAKTYWNTAIGLDETQTNCHVEFFATASDVGQMTDGWTAKNASYPVIHFDIPVTDEAGLACSQHPLNSDEVATEYTPFGEPQLFCYAFDGATVTKSADAGCSKLDLVRFFIAKDTATNQVAGYDVKFNSLGAIRYDIVNAGLLIELNQGLVRKIESQLVVLDRNFEKVQDGYLQQIEQQQTFIQELQGSISQDAVGVQSWSQERAEIIARIAGLDAQPVLELDEATWVVEGLAYATYFDAVDAWNFAKESLVGQRAVLEQDIAAAEARMAQNQANLDARESLVQELQRGLQQDMAEYNATRDALQEQRVAATATLEEQNQIKNDRYAALNDLVDYAAGEMGVYSAYMKPYIEDLHTINASIISTVAQVLEKDLVSLRDDGLEILGNITDVGEPTSIFAICNADLECHCYDSNGDTGMGTLECLTSVDIGDIYYE